MHAKLFVELGVEVEPVSGENTNRDAFRARILKCSKACPQAQVHFSHVTQQVSPDCCEVVAYYCTP
jgi:hypothetical protein